MVILRFDSKKAIEVVATLAKQSPDKRMDRKRLLAILYIANRECLRKSGRPLLGGRLFAAQYGPIHSHVLDLVNGRGEPDDAGKMGEALPQGFSRCGA